MLSSHLLSWLKNRLHLKWFYLLKSEEEYKPPELPFGGFYKNIRRLSNPMDLDLETYSDDILDQFVSVPNKLFYEDGILPLTQSLFQVGYDSVSGRITVPWKSLSGE